MILFWIQLERPSPSGVFSQNCNESLQTSKQCSVNDYRTLVSVACFVRKIESRWQLEVKLKCAELPAPVEQIFYFDINFWSVESAVTLVDFPWFADMFDSFSKSSFSNIPSFVAVDFLLRTSGKLKSVIKSKSNINVTCKLFN